MEILSLSLIITLSKNNKTIECKIGEGLGSEMDSKTLWFKLLQK